MKQSFQPSVMDEQRWKRNHLWYDHRHEKHVLIVICKMLEEQFTVGKGKARGVDRHFAGKTNRGLGSTLKTNIGSSFTG